MTISRFLRPGLPGRQSKYLAIAVFPDESVVFQAYRLLQQHGISPEHLAIVGHGYSSPERVGLMSPGKIIKRKASEFAAITGFLGSLLACSVGIIWNIGYELALGVVLAGGISSLCGAIVGSVLSFLGEGNTASIYRHHLRRGRYLLLMEGTEQLVILGQEILSHYSTASL